MKKLMRSALAVATLTGFAATIPAEAHGIWFAQRAKQTALIYGIGADDLDMVKRLPLIKATTGYDANWQPVDTALRAAGPIVLAESKGPAVALAAIMDNGNWTKAPNGKWHNAGRDKVPDAVRAEHTYKYAVHLTGQPTKPMPALPGHTLQVVPLEAIPTEMGKPLKLRVLFQGKPQAGVSVQRDLVTDPDQEPQKTDADGVVTVTLRNQGLNVIAATYVASPAEPKLVDHDEHLATLSFVLPHAEE
jgi:uncharacterized GH25 family protein